ncbi:MAG TPA: response regulator transcription factor, partial [Tepidisphaeraceae bacterium]|nr:response regulator transcription factor [Tepidisphaeraceae bacterium]
MSKGNDGARPAAGRGPAGTRSKKTVLVVDDEKDLLELICFNLQRNGFDVLSADTGTAALDTAIREQPDLIVLDLMLPGIDGLEVTRRLKGDPRTSGIPLIMLTAKAEETDVVVGLTLGADDYITKPFSPKILLARVNTVLRRSEQAADAGEPQQLKAGPLTIDTSKHEVLINGELVKLTLTEFKLLAALVVARGRVQVLTPAGASWAIAAELGVGDVYGVRALQAGQMLSRLEALEQTLVLVLPDEVIASLAASY